MKVKSLKTHDIQVFVPGLATLKGMINTGTENGVQVAMELDESTGFVTVDLKKGGLSACVKLSPSSYAFAVVVPPTPVTPD